MGARSLRNTSRIPIRSLGVRFDAMEAKATRLVRSLMDEVFGPPTTTRRSPSTRRQASPLGACHTYTTSFFGTGKIYSSCGISSCTRRRRLAWRVLACTHESTSLTGPAAGSRVKRLRTSMSCLRIGASSASATSDREVEAFLHRHIEGEHPYVWLDATFHKV
jgi:hypothetical protein